MLPWLVENTILACLLAIGVSAICRLFRPRPAIRHAMWLLVLVKLIAPPVPHLAWRLPAHVWLAESRSDDIVQPGAPAPGGQWTHVDQSPERAASQILKIEVAQVGPHPSRSAQIPELDSRPKTTSPVVGFAEPTALAGSPRGASDSVENAVDDRWTGHADFEAGISESIAGESPSVVIESIEYVPIADATDQAAKQPPLSDEEEAIRLGPDALLSSVLNSEQSNRVAVYLWLFLTAGMAVFELGRVLRFRRLVTRAKPASGWLVRQVEVEARQMRIHPPEVLVTSGCCSPVMWILWRPRLLWPERLTALLSSAAIRSVIVHELAHLARRDHWVRRFELLAGCAWWWHPLFWLVRRQLHENAELACDAWVISAYPDGRRAYAQALIEVIDFSQQRALPAPALGAGDVTRRTFERRLRMIMRERIPSRVSLAAGVLLLLACVAVLPGFSQGQDAVTTDAAATSGDAVPTDAADSPAIADAFGDFPPGDEIPSAESQPAADVAEASDLPAAESAVIADTAPAPALPSFAVTAAGPDTAASDEPAAIRRLEQQLEKLMREVKALRSQSQPGANPYGSSTGSRYGGTAASAPSAGSPYGQPTAPTLPPARGSNRGATRSNYTAANPAGSANNPYSSGTTAVRTTAGGSNLLGGRAPSESDYTAYGATNVRMLTRVTYGLPEGKAEALASFLDEQAGDRIEAKAVGQSLIVTASEEDQQTVGRFVALVASAKAVPPPGTAHPLLLDSGAAEPADGASELDPFSAVENVEN